MITTKVDYQNGSNGYLYVTCSINRISIILSLKSLLSVVKIEKSSKDGE